MASIDEGAPGHPHNFLEPAHLFVPLKGSPQPFFQCHLILKAGMIGEFLRRACPMRLKQIPGLFDVERGRS